ncbi:MAG: hypothetical protein J2P27_15165, partial [Actinobacteria bacterium]|nr:hypothetical protein [Actinomycetota bacterium]
MTYLQPLRARRATSARRGTVVGMLTALVAVGAAQLIAAAIASPGAAPIVAVGELSIDHAPAAVKNFAISTFGSADKTVLVWGIRVVLIVLAAFIGILALRRLWFGFIGLVVLAGIGVDAALGRPNATASDALPSLVGAAAGALALWYFCLLSRRILTGTAPAADQMWPARGTDTEPPHPQSSSGQPPTAPAAIPDWRPEEPLPESAWAAAEADTTNRRKFLLTGLAAAAGSLIAYAAGSRLASSRSVSASAQALRLPRPASPAPPLAAGTDLKIPGLSPFITPNNRFYRVDTALVLPEILPTDWQLRVHGMVQRELVLSFDEL